MMHLVATKGSIDKETRERIAGWLRVKFRQRGFTQREMAGRLGVTEAHVSRILHGQRDAGIDFALKMHRVFGMSMDQLVDDQPRPFELAAPILRDEDGRLIGRRANARAVEAVVRTAEEQAAEAARSAKAKKSGA